MKNLNKPSLLFSSVFIAMAFISMAAVFFNVIEMIRISEAMDEHPRNHPALEFQIKALENKVEDLNLRSAHNLNLNERAKVMVLSNRVDQLKQYAENIENTPDSTHWTNTDKYMIQTMLIQTRKDFRKLQKRMAGVYKF